MNQKLRWRRVKAAEAAAQPNEYKGDYPCQCYACQILRGEHDDHI